MHSTTSKKTLLLPYLFILPALVFFVCFLFYPLITVFIQSFFHMNLNKPYLDGFAGWENFRRLLFDDPVFRKTLGTSLSWVLWTVGLQMVFGLWFALLLNREFRMRSFFRIISFLPWAISGVLTSLMWSLMFDANIGVINDLLLRLGLIKEAVPWIAMPGTALFSVVIAELWRGLPFFTILFLAALQQIPKQLYESCAMDGVNRAQAFRHITLPLLRDTVVLSSLLRVIWEFRNVDIIMNMTGGGPARATSILTIYLTDVVVNAGNFGYGSAISAVVFLILLVFALTYLKLSRFGEENQ